MEHSNPLQYETCVYFAKLCKDIDYKAQASASTLTFLSSILAKSFQLNQAH